MNVLGLGSAVVAVPLHLPLHCCNVCSSFRMGFHRGAAPGRHVGRSGPLEGDTAGAASLGQPGSLCVHTLGEVLPFPFGACYWTLLLSRTHPRLECETPLLFYWWAP
jgi:hypothetical protein